MIGARGNEKLISDAGSVDLALDLELHIALDHHDELVGSVHEVGPHLAWRIRPEVAREAALPPDSRHALLINADSDLDPTMPSRIGLPAMPRVGPQRRLMLVTLT